MGLRVTLVGAIEKGINEHELGSILRYGVEHPAVIGAVYQPVTHAGRHVVFDPLERLTNADVMKLLAEQVPKWFKLSDFVPVLCCFPTCRSMTYALVDDDGLVPLTRLVDIENYLDYISNRFLFDSTPRGEFETLFSASASASASAGPGAVDLVAACEACGVDLSLFAGILENPRERIFGVVIQDFQDQYTLQRASADEALRG